MVPDLDFDNIQEWLQKATGIESYDKQLAFLAISVVTTACQQNTMMVCGLLDMIGRVLGIEREEE